MHGPSSEVLSFGKLYCQQLLYRIEVPLDKFNAKEFEAATKESVKEQWSSLSCAAKHPESDYHLHVAWKKVGSELMLQLAYLRGEHESGVKPQLYAEEFMEWAGRFFKDVKLEGHMHVEFDYPAKLRQSRFLLPLKVGIGPKGSNAEIDGISVSFSSRPEGVTQVWLTQQKSSLEVMLMADRPVTFKGFVPQNEIKALLPILDTLIEEKSA